MTTTLNANAVDAALRTVVEGLDSDLHRALEHNPVDDADTYHEHVDAFLDAYEAITAIEGDQAAADESPLALGEPIELAEKVAAKSMTLFIAGIDEDGDAMLSMSMSDNTPEMLAFWQDSIVSLGEMITASRTAQTEEGADGDEENA